MEENRKKSLSRRGFLKAAGASVVSVAAGGAVAGGVRATHAAQAETVDDPGWESRFSVCDMCFNKCGLIARVKDGRVVKLDPNPKFLKSRGMLCARGNAGLAQLYNPDRLKTPLKRVGARGEGKWEAISWKEAFDLAASKLKELGEKYTRCGTLFTAGSDMQSTFVHRLAEAYGSYNVTSHESLCLVSNNRAYLDTFGEVPFADVINSKYVIMAGANRFEALVTPDSMDMVTAMQNGCKLVVLDPRYTKTAALANEWYPIKPGTDMAFMLALAHVIIFDKLYDPRWVEEKLSGLDELRDHVRQLTPEWAAKETGIDAAVIRRIAHEIAEAAPQAMIYPGRRSSDYENSTQIRRSFAIVNALLGNWDTPGGLLGARQVGLQKGIPSEAPWYDDNPDERADAGIAPMMFVEEGSFVLMRDAVLSEKPYPIKGWFVYKTNPMGTAPDRKKTKAMMEAMEFVVVTDILMSDTALMADLVLPAPTYLERQDPASALQGSSACACVVQRDPVIPPLYDTKPVFEICKEIANRLDIGEHFDFTIEEYRKAQLAGLPDAAHALERDGVYYNPSKVYGIYEGKIYKTLSKKIELYNIRYKDMGLDPLPVYASPSEPSADRFRMVIGRSAVYTHSSTQDNPVLHQFISTNTLWMHPESAKRLGLNDGEMVVVSSPVGKAELSLTVTPAIRPDTVYTLTGFGALSAGLSLVHDNGASLSELVESQYDTISGNAAMHTTFVSVTRKEAA
ncbi:molybdopterin-containing oxidoreductase family protein [Desulfovibrio inopinatus]|uniref:molybdopterin-containing oxidoreductase family protein n=1 Tax=Desulfovibrio inopinatus TaxID=102109 RepID=UPI00040EB488|nr:molybdopterin-dependent oxidoreductase [Desulfovibrio inopinatus]